MENVAFSYSQVNDGNLVSRESATAPETVSKSESVADTSFREDSQYAMNLLRDEESSETPGNESPGRPSPPHHAVAQYRNGEEGSAQPRLRIRKRRRDSDKHEPPAKRRHPPEKINEGYLALLNETIVEAAAFRTTAGGEPSTTSAQLQSNRQPLQPLHHGVSIWNTEEYGRFLDAPQREAKIVKIRDRLQTKSVFELLSLDRLFQKSCTEYGLYRTHKQPSEPSNIPSATELSQKCCVALDAAADRVSAMQWEQECHGETVKYGDNWLLTEDIASNMTEAEVSDPKDVKAEAAEGTGTIGQAESRNVDQAFQLLDLDAFLELSRRIFTNARVAPDSADENMPTSNETTFPSLFASAFTDFHNLALSITKRLTASALFQANARHRARDFATGENALYVRQQDVLTAVDVLGMERDSVDFWQTAARRLGLQVYFQQRDELTGLETDCVPMSYDDIEAELGKSRMQSSRWRATEEADVPDHYSSEASGESSNDTMQDFEDDSISVDNTSSILSDEEDADERITQRLDDMDKIASREDEESLWALLELPRPQGLNDGFRPHPLEDLEITEDGKQFQTDWRDRTNYKAPWERYGTATPFIDNAPRVLRMRRDESRRGRSADSLTRGSRSSSRQSLASSSRSESRESRGDSSENRSGSSRTRRRSPSKGSDLTGHLPETSQSSDVDAKRGRGRGRSLRPRSTTPVYALDQGEGLQSLGKIPSDSDDAYEP